MVFGNVHLSVQNACILIVSIVDPIGLEKATHALDSCVYWPQLCNMAS